MTRAFCYLTFGFLLLTTSSRWPACADEQIAPSDVEAIESGRDALNGRTYFPFYDAKKDEVRRIDVQEKKTAADADNDSKWASTTGTTAPVRGGGGRSSSFASFFQVAGLTVLTLLIVAVAILLTKTFLQGEQTQTQGAKFVDTSSDVDRVEDLPFQLKRPTGDFLSEARRLYEAGQYSEAIIYLFSYELVALDKRHFIRLAKGKTNRQYLREARSREGLKQILQGTMISFEDVFFGHHELSRAGFEESWFQLDNFHHQLEQVELAAA
ncbi:hypothetical protein ETAA8_43070 [Anatilimnocola aggregata]|uniref:DUF4129 domain-containing protein n=1 Tax=Anatilimnocola aggregata TaxID=2528021 RepID=A0A517YG49_9BACT|nr:hypothetical protein [Anatilimnocola aggregata]QDU29200.1 hypothetical protein ETAA8_43070 [Anatilimnocola aggregata]